MLECLRVTLAILAVVFSPVILAVAAAVLLCLWVARRPLDLERTGKICGQFLPGHVIKGMNSALVCVKPYPGPAKRAGMNAEDFRPFVVNCTRDNSRHKASPDIRSSARSRGSQSRLELSSPSQQPPRLLEGSSKRSQQRSELEKFLSLRNISWQPFPH